MEWGLASGACCQGWVSGISHAWLTDAMTKKQQINPRILSAQSCKTIVLASIESSTH